MKKKTNKKITILISVVLIIFGVLFFSSNILFSKLKGTANLKPNTSQINSHLSKIENGGILAEIKDDEGYVMFDNKDNDFNSSNISAKMSSTGGQYNKYNIQVLAKFYNVNSEKKIVVTLKEGLNFTEDDKVTNENIGKIVTTSGVNDIIYKNNSSRTLSENEWMTIKSGGTKIFPVKQNTQNNIIKQISFNFTISADFRLDFSSISDAIKVELFEDNQNKSTVVLENSEYNFTSRASATDDAASNKINVFFNDYDAYGVTNRDDINSYVKGASIGFETYHNKLGHKYVYYKYIDTYFIVPTDVEYKTLINNGNSAWNTGIKYDVIDSNKNSNELEDGNELTYLNYDNLTKEDKEKYDILMSGQIGDYKILKFRIKSVFLHIFGLTPAWKFNGTKTSYKIIPFKLEYQTYGMSTGLSVYNESKVDNIFTIIDTEKLALPADGEYCSLQCERLFKDNKITKVSDHTVNEYNYNTVVKEQLDVDTPLGYYFYNNLSPLSAKNKVLYFKFYEKTNTGFNSNINVTNIRLVHREDYYSISDYKIKFKKKIVTKKPNGDVSISYSDWSDKIGININHSYAEIYSFLLTREKVNESKPNSLKINYVDDEGNIINEYFHELKYYIGNIRGNFDTYESSHQWTYVFGGTLDSENVEKYYYNYKIEDEGFEECEKIGIVSSDKKTCTLNNNTYKSTVDSVTMINMKYPSITGNKYLFSGFVVNDTKSSSSNQDVSYLTGNKEPYKLNYTIDFLSHGDQAQETFVYKPVIYIRDIFYQENTDFGFNNIKLASVLKGNVIDDNFIDKFNIYKGIKMGDYYYIVLVPKNNIKLDYPMLGFKTHTSVDKYIMKLEFDAKIPINYSAKDKLNYFRDLVYVTTYDNNYMNRTAVYYNSHTSSTLELYKLSNDGTITDEKVPYMHYSNDSVVFRVLSSGDIDSQILRKKDDKYITWETDEDNVNTFNENSLFRIDFMNSTGKNQNLEKQPLEIYIPVPKKDDNNFILSLNNKIDLSEKFTYSTELGSYVTVNGINNYQIYYAKIETDNLNESYIKSYDGWQFKNDIELKDINMIKIVVNELSMDQSFSVEYSLKNSNEFEATGQYYTYALYRSVNNVANEIKEGWVIGNTIGIESKKPTYIVTVKYLDKNNKAISKEIKNIVKHKDDYNIPIPTFDNYTYKYAWWERNGEIQTIDLSKITVEKDETIVLRYSTLRNIKINFVEKDGTQINYLKKPIYLQAYDIKGIEDDVYKYNEFEYIPDKLDSYILKGVSLTGESIDVSNYDRGILKLTFDDTLPESYDVVYAGLSITVDNIVVYILILLGSVSLLIGTIIFIKKRKSK